MSEFDRTKAHFEAHPESTIEEAARTVYGEADLFAMRYVQLNAVVMSLPQAPRLAQEFESARARLSATRTTRRSG